MNNTDYKERMANEYRETKARYDKLHKFIIKCKAGTQGFKLSCPIELLEEQASYMGRYLFVLEVRAEIEGVLLDKGGGDK